MPVVDAAHKTLHLKIVYYGCALSGKTTNLLTLHRLTDPDGASGLVSIATKDERTLFFDLLPVDLGKIGGFTVRLKVYTVPGQVHYEVTRRQVLGGADGVVLVVDSSPEAAKVNPWAAENLRLNLKANGLDPEITPTILQWNKRDLPQARPVAALDAELNPRHLPAFEAVAISGAGVLETFAAIAKASLRRVCERKGAPSPQTVDATVDGALARFFQNVPAVSATSAPAPPPGPAVFDHRMDTDAYHESWADRGRDRKIVDESALLAESVQAGMELAERVEELEGHRRTHETTVASLQALEALTRAVTDPNAAPLPPGLMAGLLGASGRSAGSLLLFGRQDKLMEEREVVPAGADPLNIAVAGSLGSPAYRLCQTGAPRLLDDLEGEVFFNDPPPAAAGFARAFVAPIACDDTRFGALVVYGRTDGKSFDAAEIAFWSAAGALVGLALHWRAIRAKLVRADRAPASSAAAAGR